MTQPKLEVGRKYVFEGLSESEDYCECLYKSGYKNFSGESYVMMASCTTRIFWLNSWSDEFKSIQEHIKEPMKLHTNCSCPHCVPEKYQFNNIMQSNEELMKENCVSVGEKSMPLQTEITTNSIDKEEVKLEVGKKYILKNDNDSLFTIYAFHDLVFGHLFIVISSGRTLWVFPSEIAKFKITEHREMIKHMEEGWTYLVEENGKKWVSSPCKTKAAAQSRARDICLINYKILYGRQTFEQLPEPEEKVGSTEH